jgi:hypothetical protein
MSRSRNGASGGWLASPLLGTRPFDPGPPAWLTAEPVEVLKLQCQVPDNAPKIVPTREKAPGPPPRENRSGGVPGLPL